MTTTEWAYSEIDRYDFFVEVDENVRIRLLFEHLFLVAEHAKSKYVPSNDRPDELDSLS